MPREVDLTHVGGSPVTSGTGAAGGLRNMGPAGTSDVTSVDAAAADTELLAANTDRLGLVVTNESSATLYLKLGTGASATSYTLALYAYETVSIWGVTTAIHGIWSSATGAARITEMEA